jgi:hypothetical protein
MTKASKTLVRPDSLFGVAALLVVAIQFPNSTVTAKSVLSRSGGLYDILSL